jgi:hypothetical protein
VDDVPGSVGGDVVFEFNKDTVKFSPYSSSKQCTAFIEKLPGVREAHCVKETESLPISFKIEFTAFSLKTIESNVYTHDGNPSLGDFFCDHINMMGETLESEEADVYCNVVDLNVDELPEYTECSKHGECNARSGTCSCERGFYGAACDDTMDAGDHHLFEHDGPYFTGTVMKSVAYRSPSSDFNVFVAGVAETPVHELHAYTTVRGDGTLIHSGGNVVVEQGSVTIGATNPTTLSLLDLNFNTDTGSSVKPWKDMNGTLIKGNTVLPGQFHMQLFNSETPIDSEKQTFLDSAGSFSVFNITAQGDLSTSGNLCASNRTFVVEDGMVIAESLNVVNSLDVHGSANIEDSLTIGSGFALTPEGMTIDSSTHSGPLLELRSMQENFDGSLLEINTVKGSSSSLIRAAVDEVITFDVSTTGDMMLKGLHMKSGGIEVDAGGIQVKSGGLSVDGGFTLLSGDFVLPDNNLKARTFHAENDNIAQSLLSLSSTSSDYSGTAIAVDISAAKSDLYKVLEAKAADGVTVLSVDGTGSIDSAGDISAGGDLSVEGNSRLKGGLSFEKVAVSAGDIITVPTASNVYVEITNDGKNGRNLVSFEMGSVNGQVSVVTNLDDDITTGDALIHPGSTLMFVFNNGIWRPLEALAAHFEEITGVKKLEVDNDVSVGNHTITVGGLKLMNLLRGDILVGGMDGQVRTRNGFFFTNGVLSTPSLSAEKLGGPLDAQFNVISNVMLENPQLEDATIVAKQVRVAGMTGIAYFDEAGDLRSTSELKIDESGKLVLSDLWNSIDMHSSDLHNVGEVSAVKLKDVKVAEIDKIVFPSLSDVKNGSLAFLQEDNSLDFSSSVSLDGEGRLNVKSMGKYEQEGDVNFNFNQLSDAVFVGGSADKLSSLSAKQIQLLSTESGGEPVNTVAVLTPDGLLQRDDGSIETYASSINVKSLSVSTDLHVTGLATSAVEDGVIDVLGTVLKSGQVVKTGVTLRDNALEVNHVDASVLSVEKINLKQADGKAGVLVTDSSGHVDNVQSLNVASLVSDSLRVNGAGSVDSLSVTSLSSGTDAMSLVAVDNLGLLSSSNALVVEVAAIVATESMSTPQLTIPGAETKGVLIVADESGTISSSSTIELDRVTVSQTVTVDGMLTASAVKVSGLSGSSESLLMADEDGIIRKSSFVSVDGISADSITAKKLTSSSLSLPGIEAGSVLAVSVNGDVHQASDITVQSVQSSSLAVTGKGEFVDVVLSAVRGASVLSTDETGLVVPSRDLSVSSLKVSDDATIGSLTVSSLGVPSLKAGIMSLDTSGEVSTTSVIDVNSVTAHSLDVAEKTTIRGDLQLTNAGSGVLAVDSSGTVTSSVDISVKSLVSSGTITAGELNVDSLRLSGGLTDSLLAVDANGVVSAATSKHLAHLSSETITSAKGSFDTLHFMKADTDSSRSGKTRVMTVDGNGVVNTDSTVEMLHVSTDTMAVEMADIKTLMLSTLDEGVLLSVGSKGTIQSAEGVTIRSVHAKSIEGEIIMADAMKVKSLASTTGNNLIVSSVDGTLETASAVSVKSITSDQLSVSGSSVMGSLVVDSIELKNIKTGDAAADNILGVDVNTGKVFPAKDISVDSIRTSSAAISGTVTASAFKLSGQSSSGVLSVSETGSFEAVSDVSLKKMSTEAMITDSLTLKKSGSSSGGVLVVDENGMVKNSNTVTLANVEVSEGVTVQGDIQAKHLSVTSLASGSDMSVLLAADTKGSIKPISDVVVSSLKSESITGSGKASVNSLQIPSLKSVNVLSTSIDGTVESATSIAGLDKVQGTEVSGDKLTAAVSFTMPTIKSAAVLSTDPSGVVVASTELTLDSIDVKTVSAGLFSSSSIQVKSLANGIVSTDKDGNFLSSSNIIVDEVTANAVTASKAINTGSLILSSVKSAGLLTTDGTGTVMASNKLDISSVSVDTIAVSGLSSLGSLQLPSLASSNSVVLTVDNKGSVEASSDIKVASLSATDAILSGSISVPSLFMPGADVGGVLTVANSKGAVESSASVKLVDVTAEKLIVSDQAMVNDLQVKSLSTKTTARELVVVDNTGKLTSIANLDAYLPDMKDSKFSSVETTGKISAGSFHVSSGDLIDGMVMTVDSKGTVKPSSSPTVSGMTVTSELKVQGSIQATKFVLADTASSLLVSNARNEIEALSGSQVLKDGTLSLATAKIDSLISDLTLNGNTISNLNVKKGVIKESELYLDGGAAKHGGNLVVRNLESGMVEYSDSIGVNTAGFLKTNGFVPMTSGATISITKATMSDSTLESVIINDATSIKTKSLSVKGPADFSADVFVEGSMTVGGTVMASGPYVDSSDARFKRNVSPITDALDKVCVLGGSYYEYRTEDFASRGFESGRQIGWIAQTVEAVAPELVREDSEGYKSVAYARSSALLAAAMKEMRETFELELAEVTKELRAAQNDIAELRKLLNEA